MTKFSDDKMPPASRHTGVREAPTPPNPGSSPAPTAFAEQPTHKAPPVPYTPGTPAANALAKLVKAFDDAMPEALARAEVSLAKPEAQAQLPKIAALGLWAPTAFSIPSLFGGFCEDWSKYRAMIIKARWVIRLVAGKQVAAAITGAIAMVDGVHDQACPVKPVE